MCVCVCACDRPQPRDSSPTHVFHFISSSSSSSSSSSLGSLIFLGGPNYHGDNSIVYANTPPARAQAWFPDAEVTYTRGCSVAGNDRSGLGEAEAAAAAADTVVLFLGLDDTIENEGKDRDR